MHKNVPVSFFYVRLDLLKSYIGEALMIHRRSEVSFFFDRYFQEQTLDFFNNLSLRLSTTLLHLSPILFQISGNISSRNTRSLFYHSDRLLFSRNDRILRQIF